MKGKIMFIEITTRVVPATVQQLEMFPMKDLRDYAKVLGVDAKGANKSQLAHRIYLEARPTLCASLGN